MSERGGYSGGYSSSILEERQISWCFQDTALDGSYGLSFCMNDFPTNFERREIRSDTAPASFKELDTKDMPTTLPLIFHS